MSKQILWLISFALLLNLSPLGLTAKNLDYSTLQMQDLDQMNKKVREYLEEAKQYRNDEDNENAVSSLVEATILIFSRPDADNMASNLFSEIRPRLKDLDAYESSLKAIVKNSIDTLRNKSVATKYRATQVILLENLMAELKPEASKNPKIKEIFALIKKEKVEIPKKVSSHFALKGTAKRSKNPSELAAEVLGK